MEEAACALCHSSTISDWTLLPSLPQSQMGLSMQYRSNAPHSVQFGPCYCVILCQYIQFTFHHYISSLHLHYIYILTERPVVLSNAIFIFIAFFQDAAIYVYFKYYRYCPSEIPNVEFFNGIKVPIHSGNQKASSRG